MIVQGAHAIRRGAVPDFTATEGMRRDLFLITRADPRAAREEIVSLVSERLPAHYDIDPVSEIQVFRNLEGALKRAGYTIDFEQSPGQITAHKGSTWYYVDNRGSYYDQTVVVEKAMEQEITASDLSDQLSKTGHVAVYGIHFDTGKATLQPDSEAVLQQIAQLMKDDPALKLRVEGHTDNQGAAAANQTLSEKRAQAVVAWLTSNFVPASRLTAKGFGATKPVAANTSEDGRAKNRRVELVKQ